jgi:hypothetical protein
MHALGSGGCRLAGFEDLGSVMLKASNEYYLSRVGLAAAQRLSVREPHRVSRAPCPSVMGALMAASSLGKCLAVIKRFRNDHVHCGRYAPYGVKTSRKPAYCFVGHEEGSGSVK